MAVPPRPFVVLDYLGNLFDQVREHLRSPFTQSTASSRTNTRPFVSLADRILSSTLQLEFVTVCIVPPNAGIGLRSAGPFENKRSSRFPLTVRTVQRFRCTQALSPPAVSPRTYCRMPNENRITSGIDAVMYAAIRGPMSVTPISEVNWVNATATTCRLGRGDCHQRPHELVVGRDQPDHGHGDQDGGWTAAPPIRQNA